MFVISSIFLVQLPHDRSRFLIALKDNSATAATVNRLATDASKASRMRQARPQPFSLDRDRACVATRLALPAGPGQSSSRSIVSPSRAGASQSSVDGSVALRRSLPYLSRNPRFDRRRELYAHALHPRGVHRRGKMKLREDVRGGQEKSSALKLRHRPLPERIADHKRIAIANCSLAITRNKE